MVQMYHSPLHANYEKIKKALSRGHRDVQFLRMYFFAFNGTVGPEGLCPIFLVIGIIPRPASNTPSAPQMEKTKAIDRAMDGFAPIYARMGLAVVFYRQK